MKQPEDSYTIDMFTSHHCIRCGEDIPPKRAAIGYKTCLPCGDKQAKEVRHTIAPLNKSNYMVFTDATMLKQLNPKRTT